MTPARPRTLIAATLLCVTAATAPARATAAEPDHRAWIAAMKTAERGPFARIRWFCKDGTVLPPQPYACKDHGGGEQHGEWSEQTRELREAGYLVATVFASLDVPALLASPSVRDDLAQILVERFLVQVDDGWILRRARFYRGAFQEEAERKGARRLLLALVANNDWVNGRFLPLRMAATLLPHGRDTPTANHVRQLALSLSERDPGFMSLRAKIHSFPTRADAGLVREYAAGSGDPGLRKEYELLAAEIDSLHDSDPRAALDELLDTLPAQPETLARLRKLAADVDPRRDPLRRFAATAALLQELRDIVSLPARAESRLHVLDVSIALEAENFAVGTQLRERVPRLDRRQRLALLGDATNALYGVGMLSGRQLGALQAALKRLDVDRPPLALYRRDTRYLALTADWASQQLAFHFGTGMARLAELELHAMMFTQDLLRGSPLLLHSAIIDGLVRDGSRLAGVETTLFGQEVGAGVRAINPGLARGVLRDGRTLHAEEFKPDGIYLLPETTAELTPVAGIITAGEGNALSHVQILARSLGIPNAAVADSLIKSLMPHVGKPVVLAVSHGGTVALAGRTAALDAALGRQSQMTSDTINLDMDRLDLGFRELVDLSRLGVADSGRIVGPKAAKLGELKRHFPAEVTEGIAIPFGVFRALLERPSPDGATPMFQWMAANYRRIEKLPAGSPEQQQASEQLRAAIFDWVAAARPDAAFLAALRERLAQRFGAEGSYGVFVRSDTNVEDLPDFTGAGLNLTLPNVVGFENVVAAIQKVWASPFSARAFAWRQSRMAAPEHVYPAILLLKGEDAEKSGVLITADLETGARDWLSVAVNEGVGGAVDNQAAESLRIHRNSDEIRLMAQASAPFRRRLDAAGGVKVLPASGADRVLADSEIRILRAFTTRLEQKFPAIVDGTGQPTPADVEFGFSGGKLKLFQVRPFLENAAAAGSAYLRSLDPDAARMRDATVDMQEVPK